MLTAGRWSFLERLKGVSDPEALFCSVPGVGPQWRIASSRACILAHWRRWRPSPLTGGSARFPDLARVAFAVARNALADLLGRIRTPPRRVEEEPSVATLLDVDREYRDAAARGALRKIAPELFIPGGEAWLPVLHATRGPWHFTALYSNTARARTSADG